MNAETKILITGANTMIGRMTAEKATANGNCAVCTYTDEELKIYDRLAVAEAIKDAAPDWIINCSGFHNIDANETHREEALRANIHGPQIIGEIAAISGAKVLHVSTDLVFDGNTDKPYDEEDLTAPETVLGKTKRLGELALLEVLPEATILRTGPVFGPYSTNFVNNTLKAGINNEEVIAVSDHKGSPVYSEDAADCILNLIDNDARGLYHFSNAGICTWYEFTEAIFAEARNLGIKLKVAKITPVMGLLYQTQAKRPRFLALDTTKYQALPNAKVPPWQESLKHYLQNHLEIERGEVFSGLY